jgi:hypothetical protein
MKINSYSVQAESNWKFHSEDIAIRSLKQATLHIGVQPQEQKGTGGAFGQPVSLNLSDEAKKLITDMRRSCAGSNGNRQLSGLRGSSSSRADSPGNYAIEIRRNILEALMERLTGKKFSFKSVPVDLGRSRCGYDGGGTAVSSDSLEFSEGTRASKVQLITTDEEFYSSHYESESLRYEAKAQVNTADGRSISVDISLSMSREMLTSVSGAVHTAEVRNVVDPLVINFSGTAASLTERKFEFDLDSDGKADSISFAGEGSGFLAFDRNGDGIINDGSELFGPQSGSGFGELRAYDADGNGWIDENDDIFSKLRVWSKDADGGDMLFTLKEADVGAIFLGDISTQYTLGSGGGTDGMLRSTSMYLKESGGAGLISHIDLAV